MKKVRVSAVSYLNTRPFLYGLTTSPIVDRVEIALDFPSVVAEKLINGFADVGLVPAVSIQEIPNAKLISNYCIGSDGEVGSVCIYSQVPIENITGIYLDYQSRTSTELARILLRDFWKVNPSLIHAREGYESRIVDSTAGLIIGDRSLQLKESFKYCYDLGRAWKSFTGLPFVFACWVTNSQLTSDFIHDFNAALVEGINNISTVAKLHQPDFSSTNVYDYLTQKIQFHLDEAKLQSLDHFLSMVSEKPAEVEK